MNNNINEYINDIIRNKGYKYIYIANMLQISPQNLSNKIRGVNKFTLVELIKLSVILQLTKEEKLKIFELGGK